VSSIVDNDLGEKLGNISVSEALKHGNGLPEWTSTPISVISKISKINEAGEHTAPKVPVMFSTIGFSILERYTATSQVI
jgi:hypothetical protein